MEPSLYCALSLIKISLKLSGELRSKCLLSALCEMDEGVEISDSSASLFYFRSLLHCYLGYFPQALSDIDKAIEKSEDNVPKYFFLRGHAFACC